MADSTVTNLTANTAPASTDLLHVVVDPATTPVDRKVTLSNLTKGLAAATASLQGVVTTAAQTWAGIKTLTGTLILRAGSAAAGTAPIKFQAGPLLTSVEAGAMEFFNNALWFTNLAVRRTVVQTEEVLVADVTVANTAVETTVYSVPHGAGYVKVGKLEEIFLAGTITSTSGADGNTLTVRVKYAGSTIATFTAVEAARSAVDFEIVIQATCRAIGAGSTSWQVRAGMDINGSATDPVTNALSTGHDSTTAQATTVTFQWSDADVGNTITILQGRTTCEDDN